MYTVIKKKGLQDFVGIVYKCKVVHFVWGRTGGRERKDGIVIRRYFLLSLWFCFFFLKRKEEKKALNCMSMSYMSLKHKL